MHNTCVKRVQCRTQVHPVRKKLLSKTGWRQNPAGKYSENRSISKVDSSNACPCFYPRTNYTLVAYNFVHAVTSLSVFVKMFNGQLVVNHGRLKILSIVENHV